ncbi:MAG: T9SS type A sorting domain-containing protein [Sphingobacteriia bacterium]
MLLLLPVWGFSQPDYGDIIWKRRLGGSGTPSFEAFGDRPTALTVSGGFTYVAGYSNSNDGDFPGNRGEVDAWVVKLARDGSVLWKYQFGGNAFETVRDITVMPNGDVVVVGETFSSNLFGYRSFTDAFVLRLTPNGQEVYTKLINGTGLAETLNTSAFEYFQGVDTVGTELVAVGRTSNFYLNSVQDTWDTLSGSLDAWIHRLDASGNYLWNNRVFRNDTINNLSQEEGAGGISAIIHRFNDVVHLDRGGYLAVGDAAFFAEGNVGDAYLARFDEAGDTVWTRLLGGTQGDDGLKVRETPDGNVVVLLERRKPKAGNFPEPDLWLAKINTTTGSTMWERIVGSNFIDSPQDIILAADTIVAVVGWEDVDQVDLATGYDGFVDRYDARTGASIGSRRLFGTSGKDDRAYAVGYDVQTDDYVIACTSIGTSSFFPENSGGTDWWIIRMAGDNSAFQQWVSRADGQPGIAHGEELRAWPNPARGSLSLNRTDLDYVELYNLAGMRVQRWDGAALPQQLDLSGLGAGMYLLKAEKGSQSWNQKIVIQ